MIGTNRLSSTIGGNRNGPIIYDVTSVKYNKKTKFSHISWHVSQD